MSEFLAALFDEDSGIVNWYCSYRRIGACLPEALGSLRSNFATVRTRRRFLEVFSLHLCNVSSCIQQ